MSRAEELLKEIQDASISQVELAKKVGVSPEHLNAVLNGRYPLTDQMDKRITYWYEHIKSTKQS